MIRSLFAVYDSVAGEQFGPLILLPNSAAARRLFQDALFGQGSAMASHPEDYSLFYVGELDTETGQISQSDGPVYGPGVSPLISGADVVLMVQRQQSASSSSPDVLDQELAAEVPSHG